MLIDPLTQYELIRRYPVTQTNNTVPSWVGLQGFLLGFFLAAIGVVVAVIFSSPEKRKRRTGWAIGGLLTMLTAAVMTSV